MTTIIKLAFAKNSTNIHVGLTKNNNKTLTGEIVFSDDLVVSHYNCNVMMSGETAVGKIGTVCIADDCIADQLIDEIDNIQIKRPVNARGNRYPFVFLTLTEGDIIFNRGLNGGVDRLTFLDVECVEVHADAPEAVVQIEKPVVRSSSIADARAANSYGTVSYREVRKRRLAQKEAARKSVEKAALSSQMEAVHDVQNVPVQRCAPSASPDAPTGVAGSGGRSDEGGCEITDEEREILVLEGGFNNKYISTLSREKADKLLAALSPKLEEAKL